MTGLRLSPLLGKYKKLNEMEFRNRKEFDAYRKVHKLRPSTKIKIAGVPTTVGQVAKKGSTTASKGTSVFSNQPKSGDKPASAAKVQNPPSDHKNMVKHILKNTDFDESGAYKLSEVGDDLTAGLQSGDSKANSELISKLKNKENGTYIHTHEMGGNILFNNGDHYVINSGEGGEINAIKISDIKGPKPTDKDWDTESVYNATFVDPETKKTISVEDAYNGDEDSEAYAKAEEYIMLFNPDDERLVKS